MDTSKITIAVDGFSSCGKSTLAKDLARELKMNYIDTGAMYRAVTLFAIRKGWISEEGEIRLEELGQELPHVRLSFKWDNQLGRSAIFLNGEDVEEEIRLPHVAKWVSKVAAQIPVRRALVSMQQQMGKEGGVILDGRDVGSVVFPNAELKLFVTADPEVRAQRRLDEMLGNGVQATFEDVLENLQQRDDMDCKRVEGPLVQVPDAVVLDTTFLTKREQLDFVLNKLQEKYRS